MKKNIMPPFRDKAALAIDGSGFLDIIASVFGAGFRLGWRPVGTTSICLGTGRHGKKYREAHFDRRDPLKWIRMLKPNSEKNLMGNTQNGGD